MGNRLDGDDGVSSLGKPTGPKPQYLPGSLPLHRHTCLINDNRVGLIGRWRPANGLPPPVMPQRKCRPPPAVRHSFFRGSV